jgi:hypothetical protein
MAGEDVQQRKRLTAATKDVYVATLLDLAIEDYKRPEDERRNLYQDVAGLFAGVAPAEGSCRSRQCLWWDFPDLLSWSQVNTPVRVIRSLETYAVRRQLDGKDGPQTAIGSGRPRFRPKPSLPGGPSASAINDGISRTMGSTSWSTTGIPTTSI